MTTYLRLRHVVLATDDLERAKRDFTAIFGIGLAFEDPLAKDFEVVNAIFPFGLAIVEVMEPMHPGAPSARFLKTTGGHGGYMLAFNCNDPERRSERAQELGVRLAARADYPGFVGYQMHPRDCRAAMIEFDRTDGEEDIHGPLYAGGGLRWRDAVRTDETRAIAEVVLQAREPEDLAQHWSRLLERPVLRVDDGAFAIETDLLPLRFEPGASSRETLAALRLDVRDPQAILNRAAERGYPTSERAFSICGVEFRL